MRLSAALASQIVVVLLTRLRLAPAMARNTATADEVSSWTTLQGTCHRVIEGPRDVGATLSEFDSRAGVGSSERVERKRPSPLFALALPWALEGKRRGQGRRARTGCTQTTWS